MPSRGTAGKVDLKGVEWEALCARGHSPLGRAWLEPGLTNSEDEKYREPGRD